MSRYNLDRQPVTRVDGRGNPWSTVYDGYGRVASSSDPLGNRQEAEYDNAGHVTSSRAFDASGNLLAESAAVYDARLRPIESHRWLWTEGDGSVRPGDAELLISQVKYDAAGNVVKTVDALNREATMSYDSAERLIETVDPLSNRLVLTLDAAGNVTQRTAHEKDPQGGTVQVSETASFDALDRLFSTTDGAGNVTTTVYDARSQVTSITEPGSHVTAYTYDGLDRAIQEARPEGIIVTHEYDKSSRRTAYVDAQGHRTTWAYDAVSRPVSITYPDAESETFLYDAAHNPVQRVDQNGTTIAQSFDLANRLVARTVTADPGYLLEGPLSESFVYDGLDRLTQAQSGTITTDLTYDSLSRQLSETTLGRQVSYESDQVDNRIRIGYPSGVTIAQTFDDLDRPVAIGHLDGATLTPRVEYGYRGPGLVQQKSVGQSIIQNRTFDAARRPIQSQSLGASGVPVVQESLTWSPRSLKVGSFRGDLGGRGWVLGHDGAHRLVHAERTDQNLGLAANAAPSLSSLAAAEHRFSFTHDNAQNLLSRIVVEDGVSSSTTLPPDASGRNRPGSVDGVTLLYDANGNLIQKGNLTFRYDFHNRLTRVLLSGVEVARYEYDAFNRRVRQHLPSEAQPVETVWSGWREIEEYRQGQRHWRKTFGRSIDEVVYIEADQDLNGSDDQELVPHYDATGNVVAWTDPQDSVVGRAEYSPFGEQMKMRADATAPRVVQVWVEGGEIRIEMSEEITVDGSQVSLTATAVPQSSSAPPAKTALSTAIAQPVQEGRRARRSLALTPATPPTVGEEVELRIEPEGARDLFHNPLTSAFSVTFTWPDPAGSGVVVTDTAAPEIDELRLRDGHLEIGFSEPPDFVSASAAIEVNGQTVTWVEGGDDYTLRSSDPLSEGTYTVRVPSGAAVDRAGKGPVTTFEETFTVLSGDDVEKEIHLLPDAHEVPPETFAARLSFHGRPLDLETGFLYFRNRYLDPELGRFITADPLGYVDGPSMYQGFLNSPLSYSDSLGLAVGDWWDPRSYGGVLNATFHDIANGLERSTHPEIVAIRESLAATDGMAGAVRESAMWAAVTDAAWNKQTFGLTGFLDSEDKVGFAGDATGVGPLLGGMAQMAQSALEGNGDQFLLGAARASGGGGKAILLFVGARGGWRLTQAPSPRGSLSRGVVLRDRADTPSSTGVSQARFLEYKMVRAQGYNASEAHSLMKQFDANSNISDQFGFHFTKVNAAESILSSGQILPTRYGYLGPGVYYGTTPMPNLFLKGLIWGVPRTPVRLPINLVGRPTQTGFWPPCAGVIRSKTPVPIIN